MFFRETRDPAAATGSACSAEMGRPASGPGHAVKLPVGLYASAVKAAELQGLTVGQWVEKAVGNELAQDRATFRFDRYWHLRRHAERNASLSMPRAHEHGLPEEFDMSSPPSIPSPFVQFRR